MMKTDKKKRHKKTFSLKFFRQAGRKGGKVRAAKYDRKQISEWGERGGRPPKPKESNDCKMTKQEYRQRKRRELFDWEKEQIRSRLDQGATSKELAKEFGCVPIQVAGVKAAQTLRGKVCVLDDWRGSSGRRAA